MNFISFFIKSLIKKANAQINVSDYGVTMCYLGTADLQSTVTKLIQWVLNLITPVLALVLAIKNAINLLKRKTFSLYYAVYKSFLRVIILILISIIILFIAYYVDTTSDIVDEEILTTKFNEFLLAVVLVSLIICGATGLGYLFFSSKNKKFLLLSLYYFFVVPGIVIFITVLILNLIPGCNKYLPTDAIIFKKKQLRDKLIEEGKIPNDTEKKP